MSEHYAMRRSMPATLATPSVKAATEWLYGWCYGVEMTSDELRGALAVLGELRRVAALPAKPGGVK